MFVCLLAAHTWWQPVQQSKEGRIIFQGAHPHLVYIPAHPWKSYLVLTAHLSKIPLYMIQGVILCGVTTTEADLSVRPPGSQLTVLSQCHGLHHPHTLVVLLPLKGARHPHVVQPCVLLQLQPLEQRAMKAQGQYVRRLHQEQGLLVVQAWVLYHAAHQVARCRCRSILGRRRHRHAYRWQVRREKPLCLKRVLQQLQDQLQINIQHCKWTITLIYCEPKL